MVEKEYLSILPAQGKTLCDQLDDCLGQFSSGPHHKISLPGRILKMSLFIRSEDNQDLEKKAGQVTRILNDYFRDDLPPFSIIAQSPENELEIAVYVEALPSGKPMTTLRYSISDGIPYCTVHYGDHREVYGAGLTVGNKISGTKDQSTGAFTLMRHMLEREKMIQGHIVRQWNYIEGILRLQSTPSGNRQNYQVFNDVRRQFYSESSFPSGFPAATGIGMDHGGVVIEFQAVSPSEGLKIVPLSNPLQRDAHRYSQEVLIGDAETKNRPKASPLFERGKYLGWDTMGIVFISGTAAIREQATSPQKDIETQTKVTTENILKLISKDNLRNHGIATEEDPSPLSYLRAYVKRRQDLSVVKRICQQSFGHVPSQYLTADICRDDLLVELEGIVYV